MTIQNETNAAKPAAADKAEVRKQRQAEQLRANLLRRKEQMRQRDSADKSSE